MNRRSIQQIIRKVLHQRAGDRLARLPEAIRQHAETGIMPTDPVARAYVELTEAAIGAMDAGIGGGAAHDAACRQFEAAYERWQRALQEAEA